MPVQMYHKGLKLIMRKLKRLYSYFKRDRKLPLGCISKIEIKKYLSEDINILEAGAANGSDTIEMSQLFPKATIYAFEPIPFYFKQLQNTVINCKNVKVFQYAIGDKSGISKFNLSRIEDGSIVSSSSLLNPKKHVEAHPHILFNDSISVNTITIDDFCSQNRIERLDFLWLDLQGSEYQALISSPKILETVKVIHAEVSLIDTYEGVVLYPEFKKWLNSKGFIVVIEELPFKDMGNVLFVRK
jgi:FkbM family methyltransferase